MKCLCRMNVLNLLELHFRIFPSLRSKFHFNVWWWVAILKELKGSQILYRWHWHSESFTLFLVHLITHKTIPLSPAKQAGSVMGRGGAVTDPSALPSLAVTATMAAGPVCHSDYTNSKHPLSVLRCLRPMPPTTRGSGCQTQHTSGTDWGTEAQSC